MGGTEQIGEIFKPGKAAYPREVAVKQGQEQENDHGQEDNAGQRDPQVAQDPLLLLGGILVWILEIVSLGFTVSAVVEIISSGGGLADLQNLTTPMVSNMLISWAVTAVSTAFYVFYYIALFKAYRSCAAGNAAWMLVLSIFFSTVAEAIIFFSIRKKDAGFIELQRRAAEASYMGE